MAILIHNETTEYLDSCGLKRTDDFEDPSTKRTYPCYEMGDFINTVEGWNLFVACAKKNDLQPYYDAKEAYNRAKEELTNE